MTGRRLRTSEIHCIHFPGLPAPTPGPFGMEWKQKGLWNPRTPAAPPQDASIDGYHQSPVKTYLLRGCCMPGMAPDIGAHQWENRAGVDAFWKNSGAAWSTGSRRDQRCRCHPLPSSPARVQSPSASLAPDSSSVGPALQEGSSCPTNSFRCSAELTGLQNLRHCLGGMAKLLTAYLSRASVSASVATVPRVYTQSREDSSREAGCWVMLFLAQMAGTLAEAGPASQGRDVSESSSPFPGTPESPHPQA